MSNQESIPHELENENENINVPDEEDGPDQIEQYIVLDEDDLDNRADNSVNEGATSSDIVESEKPSDKTKNEFMSTKLQKYTDILSNFASELVNGWLVEDIGTSDKTVDPEDLPLICEWCHSQCSSSANFEKHKRKKHHRERQAVYNLLSKGPKAPDFMRPRKIRKLQMKEKLKKDATSNETACSKMDEVETIQESSVAAPCLDVG